jgi:hypothetical protein
MMPVAARALPPIVVKFQRPPRGPGTPSAFSAAAIASGEDPAA